MAPSSPLRSPRARLGVLTASLAVAAASILAGGTSPAVSAVGDACPEAFPVEEVAADQAVTGLTVDSGLTPEEFQGTVLGVLEDGIAPGLDMIMVRLTSAEIDRVGGIWAGMSGSPVYAEDGRLLGAVAYGFAGTTPVAGVTPAAEMRDLLDGGALGRAADTEVAVPRRLERELVASGDATARQVDGGLVRLPTPVAVSGLQGARQMNKAAKRLGITNLRGLYRTDGQGRYEIRTVRPVPYPIPDDGPVGRLLRDTGRHPWRAAHVHAKVEAPGFEPLTTHVFDADSDHLDSDTVFGVKESLVEEFVPGGDGVLVCDHDFVLRKTDGPVV